MKILKAVTLILAGVTLAIVGICVGITVEKKNVEELAQTTHKVTTVAVINLDEGISVDGNYKYYSGELLQLPSSNYVITSYDDAMNGVKEGRYGAYVIIPATFSESVESLNGTPMEAYIQYEYDPELSDESKLTVQQNIVELEDSLLDNVSYVYVANVMSNFHQAQDDVKGVLANDIEDLDNITSIDADELAVQLAYRDLDVVAYDISTVDVSSYINENTTNISGIQGVYDAAKQKCDEQTNVFKEELNGISSDIDDYENHFSNLEILNDDNGTLRVQNELDDIKEKMNLTENSREQAKDEIKYELKKQLYCSELAYQEYVDSNFASYNSGVNSGIDYWYSSVQANVEASIQTQLDQKIAEALNNKAINPMYIYTPGDMSINISWEAAYSAGSAGGIDISQARNNYSSVSYDESDAYCYE